MVGPVIVVAANALMPAPPEKALVDNPLALGGVAGRLAGVAAWGGVALLVAGLPAALVCVAPRFRAARGVQRRQLR
jgi:hypothetical protein